MRRGGVGEALVGDAVAEGVVVVARVGGEAEEDGARLRDVEAEAALRRSQPLVRALPHVRGGRLQAEPRARVRLGGAEHARGLAVAAGGGALHERIRSNTPAASS